MYVSRKAEEVRSLLLATRLCAPSSLPQAFELFAAATLCYVRSPIYLIDKQELSMDPRAPTPAQPPPKAEEAEKPEEAEKADERLDEELDETFPASDPIPYRHDS
jgi:hypothetical protein